MISWWEHQWLWVCKYENTYVCESVWTKHPYVSHIMSLDLFITVTQDQSILRCKKSSTVLSLFQIYVSIWYSVQLFRGTRRCNFNLSSRWRCAIEVSVALWLINEMYELTVLWFWSFTTQWQAQSCSECISSSVPDCHNHTLLPAFEQNFQRYPSHLSSPPLYFTITSINHCKPLWTMGLIYHAG